MMDEPIETQAELIESNALRRPSRGAHARSQASDGFPGTQAAERIASLPKRDRVTIIVGAIIIVFGLLMMLITSLSMTVIAIMAGATLLASGVLDIVNFIRYRKYTDIDSKAILFAILYIVLGCFFMANPMFFGDAFQILLIVGLIIFGIVEVLNAVHLRRTSNSLWVTTMVIGIVSAIGGLILLFWPSLLGVIIGLAVAFRGCQLLMFGFSASKFAR